MANKKKQVPPPSEEEIRERALRAQAQEQAEKQAENERQELTTQAIATLSSGEVEDLRRDVLMTALEQFISNQVDPEDQSLKERIDVRLAEEMLDKLTAQYIKLAG